LSSFKRCAIIFFGGKQNITNLKIDNYSKKTKINLKNELIFFLFSLFSVYFSLSMNAGNDQKVYKKKLFANDEQLEINIKKEKKPTTKIIVNGTDASLFDSKEGVEITLHPVQIQKPTSKVTVVKQNAATNATALKQKTVSKFKDDKQNKKTIKLIPLWEKEDDEQIIPQQIYDDSIEQNVDKSVDIGNKSASKNENEEEKENNNAKQSKSQQNILNKILQKQDVTNSTEFIIPTGSALFGLKDIPHVENENNETKEEEDVLDFRLMQKLRKQKKKQKEESIGGNITPTVVVVKENRANAPQQALTKTEQQTDNYLNNFMHTEAKSVDIENEKKNDKAKKEQIENEQPPYQTIECDVNSLDPNKMFDDAEMKFYESSEYKYMPMPEIKTDSSPQLKFSGSVCSHIGSVVQEDARDNKDGDLHVSFGWADLAMEIAGIVNDDFKYKYSANLQVVPSDVNVTDNYAEFSCLYGTVQIGNIKGPEGTMIDDATGLLGGTGGVDGSTWGLLNIVSGLPHTHHLNGYTKRATKLVYYSPRFAGFQVGAGFCPNPHHSGWSDLGAKDYSNSNDDNVLSTAEMKKSQNLAIGVNYQQSVKDLSVKASIVAVMENASMKANIKDIVPAEGDDIYLTYDLTREIPLKKDMSYQASCSIQYKNLVIAAGLINNREQNLPTTKFNADKIEKNGIHLGDAGTVWNIGGKYTIGRIDLGFSHHNLKRRATNYDYSTGTINTFTLDCTVSSGIQLFAEIDHINARTEKNVSALDDNSKPVKNNGTVVLVGSKLNF
jgi:predicted porin